MNPRRARVLSAIAALMLGVLGWDAYHPPADVSVAIPPNATSSQPRSGGTAQAHRTPRFVHLSAEPVLRPGERLTVRGRVREVPTNTTVTVSLEGPDGSMASAELRGDPSHEAGFAIQHPAPAIAPGRFYWKLHLNTADDPVALGVRVDPSVPPRVLLLLDEPSIEGLRLQRWLTQAGSRVSTRTRVSAERYRVTPPMVVPRERESEPSEALSFGSVDGVVAQEAALHRLSPAELESLDLAMRRDGVGLLVFDPVVEIQSVTNDTGRTSSHPGQGDFAGDSLGSAESTGIRPLVSPWVIQSKVSTDPSDRIRETRIRLVDGTVIDVPVSVLAAELVVPPGSQWMATDSQDRPLVASGSHGRGRWVLSLVVDSWRWRQHGLGNDYARFWSTLISTVARPASPSSGEWSLVEPSLPLFVNQPVSLVGAGEADAPLPEAEVRALDVPDEPPIPLILSRAPQELARARTVFWPVHSGWHSVRTLPTGPTFEFNVQPSMAWPAVQAQRRQDADRRIADLREASTPRDSSQRPSSSLRGMVRVSAFVLFVISAAGLWSAPRRPRGSAIQG